MSVLELGIMRNGSCFSESENIHIKEQYKNATSFRKDVPTCQAFSLLTGQGCIGGPERVSARMSLVPPFRIDISC